MPKVVPIVISLVALALLAGGGFTARSSMELQDVGESVTGTVIRYTTSTSDGDTTYSPVYVFEFRGQRYEHESSIGTGSPPTIGEQEPLLVDPNDPTRVKEDSFMGLWFMSAMLGGFGAVTLVIALILATVAVRAGLRQRREEPSTSRGPFL